MHSGFNVKPAITTSQSEIHFEDIATVMKASKRILSNQKAISGIRTVRQIVDPVLGLTDLRSKG